MSKCSGIRYLALSPLQLPPPPRSSVSMVGLEFHIISFALLETSVSLTEHFHTELLFLLRTKNPRAISAALMTKEFIGLLR